MFETWFCTNILKGITQRCPKSVHAPYANALPLMQNMKHRTNGLAHTLHFSRLSQKKDPIGSNIGREKMIIIMSCRRYETYSRTRWRTYGTLKPTVTISTDILHLRRIIRFSPSKSSGFNKWHVPHFIRTSHDGSINKIK